MATTEERSLDSVPRFRFAQEAKARGTSLGMTAKGKKCKSPRREDRLSWLPQCGAIAIVKGELLVTEGTAQCPYCRILFGCEARKGWGAASGAPPSNPSQAIFNLRRLGRNDTSATPMPDLFRSGIP